jgi:16S rRNA (cytosine1402-N4)-methyltransferase
VPQHLNPPSNSDPNPQADSPLGGTAAGGSYGHVPVLLEEVLAALAPEPGRIYVDTTLGAGGHAEALLERLHSKGLLIGVDQDPVALKIAEARLSRFGEQAQFLNGNFSQLREKLPTAYQPLTGGVLADLGVSSMQLDTGARGFSFSKEAPLDMRMSPETPLTAEIVVNTYEEDALLRIFSEYGEEHMSKTVARAIVQQRKSQPFQTTTQLAQLISQLYGSKGKSGKIHPATRVFQALRIEVNDEFGHLKRFLDALPGLLAPGARVAVISFHSLEDRIIKQFFQAESKDCICPPRFPICQCGHKAAFRLLSGKPVTASEAEIKANPRSRSAKLRAAIRL